MAMSALWSALRLPGGRVNPPAQFCQWVLDAGAGHPILGRAIDFVVYRRGAAWPPCMPSPAGHGLLYTSCSAVLCLHVLAAYAAGRLLAH